MKNILLTAVVIAAHLPGFSQQINRHVREANDLYRQGKFDLALPEYRQSVSAGANDPVTNYNLGNALFRTQNFAEAATTYEQTANASPDNSLKQRAHYNQGVSYSRHQKLEESIEAYKKAVIMDPADEDARINLQKALTELKKKQPPEQKKQDEQKKPKDKQEQKNPQPKSNLTRKQVEQLLKALQQREQQVQQKMQQNRNRTAGQQEKDW